MINWFRALRFLSIFLGWLFFLAYIQDQSQKWMLYVIPLSLTFGIILGPIQKKMYGEKENGE